MKIGILRETKDPPDRRVPFAPGQVRGLEKLFPGVEVVVQPGPERCFSDREYLDHGVSLSEDLTGCDLLMGVKEVVVDTLIPGKAYLFFSHTAKKQPHNRGLLQAVVKMGITLIDYEHLTGPGNTRLVSFGRWAGMVGAYNGLRAWGERYHSFRLKPAHECYDRGEMSGQLQNVSLPGIKILVTGGGRVAGGAMETIAGAGIREVRPDEFLKEDFEEPVVCRIDPWHYVRRKDGEDFGLQHFFDHPGMYESTFKPYTKVTDLFIACHYWDPRSPVFMTLTGMKEPGFKIRVIADVSCDLNGPIPSTVRASTIEDPFYGFYPLTGREIPPFELRGITVMAVDNLPGELPRDASLDFGNMLTGNVMPLIVKGDEQGIIDRATIVRKGKLTPEFVYLQDYLEGKE